MFTSDARKRGAATPRRSGRAPARTTRGRRSTRPVLELMEGRLLLTTYFVTTTANSGEGSLRQAILDSNSDTTQANTIRFALEGPGLTITPTTPLPAITQPVTIDGTTQPGYVDRPIVELVGSANVTVGLNVTAGSSTVKGLVLNRFGDSAVILAGPGGSSVVGSHIGTNVAGTADLGNWYGVRVTSPNNTIGGTTPGSRNVISGNVTGIYVNTAAATGNLIQGNYVGTNIDGTARLGNTSWGISIEGARTTIGGTTAEARNVISGNGNNSDAQGGVYTSAAQTLIQGNYIGTNAGGDGALGNRTGVLLASQNNTVGGTTSAERNVISGNRTGVWVNPGGNSNFSYDGFNVISGNYIGVDASGSNALANITGVNSSRSTGNTIGGTAAGAGNVIAGNTGQGIVAGFGGLGPSPSLVVQGNRIGINAAGAPLGNGGSGITVEPAGVVASPGVVIGGTAAGAANVIANNARGVELIQANSIRVEGNQIENNRGPGVVVRRGARNSILDNRISGNLGLGIDLDEAAGLPAPNNLINSPRLLSVVDAGGGQKTVRGIYFDDRIDTPGFRIQFFANASYTAQGTTEGAHHLGEITVSTSGAGRAPFEFTYEPVAGLPVLSATVTDANGNTSEFSTRPAPPRNILPVS